LPLDKIACEKLLKEDAKKNIDVGAQILKEKYNIDGGKSRTFSGACTLAYQSTSYTGWNAALRGYNGWGCGEDKDGNKFVEQDKFVDEVNHRYEELKKLAPIVSSSETSGSGSSSTPKGNFNKVILNSEFNGDATSFNILNDDNLQIPEPLTERTLNLQVYSEGCDGKVFVTLYEDVFGPFNTLKKTFSGKGDSLNFRITSGLVTSGKSYYFSLGCFDSNLEKIGGDVTTESFAVVK